MFLQFLRAYLNNEFLNMFQIMEEIDLMYKRYADENNLITDVNELQLSDQSEVLIYREDEWYDEIVVILSGQEDRFEELKPLISLAAKNLCEMDYMAQRYSALHGDNEFADGYVVSYICFPDSDLISLTYYGTNENTEFDVVFQYRNDRFLLKSFGMNKDVKEDWDQ